MRGNGTIFLAGPPLVKVCTAHRLTLITLPICQSYSAQLRTRKKNSPASKQVCCIEVALKGFSTNLLLYTLIPTHLGLSYAS